MFVALVNWDRCTGCGDCVSACPVAVGACQGLPIHPLRLNDICTGVDANLQDIGPPAILFRVRQRTARHNTERPAKNAGFQNGLHVAA